MSLALAPWDNLTAMSVLRDLDPNDRIEAQLISGHIADHLDIFSDWRAMQAGAVLSLILKTGGPGGRAFGVLALGHTGQAGVAQAALLARDHRRHARALARAALTIRAGMPEFCTERGIHRVEARSWAHHPTAGRFLRACGFRFETPMPGFGADGMADFHQFAWTTRAPNPNGD